MKKKKNNIIILIISIVMCLFAIINVIALFLVAFTVLVTIGLIDAIASIEPINHDRPEQNIPVPVIDEGFPDVFIIGDYKLTTNVENGQIHKYRDYESDYNLPKHVIETDDGNIIKLNNKVYSLKDGNMELIFEADSKMSSIVYANEDYIIYTYENNATTNSIWKYDIDSGSNIEIIQHVLKHDYIMYLADDYLFVLEDSYSDGYYFNELYNIYYTNLITNEMFGITKLENKDIDEIQSLFSNEINIIESNDKYMPYELFMNDMPIDRTIYGYSVPDNIDYEKYGEYNSRLACKSRRDQYYDNRIYTIIVKGIFDIMNGPYYENQNLRNNIHKMYSLEWEYDCLKVLYQTQNDQVDDYYNEEKTRFLGYRPEKNLLYTYSFEDGTICTRNLDDGTVTVIETLEYDKIIQFEWIDTRLYWFYINDEEERYGGVYDFADDEDYYAEQEILDNTETEDTDNE